MIVCMLCYGWLVGWMDGWLWVGGAWGVFIGGGLNNERMACMPQFLSDTMIFYS